MKKIIDELQQIAMNISFCTECPLHETRKNTCPGNIKRTEETKEFIFMFIGEAPGAEEDESGKVFVGRAGKLLKKVLFETGFEDFFITNTIKCRPPENRDPSAKEMEECGHFLVDQIDAVRPKVIVCVGKKAREAMDILFQDQWPYEVITIYHPAYILRQMSKYDTWKAELLRIKEKYMPDDIPF